MANDSNTQKSGRYLEDGDLYVVQKSTPLLYLWESPLTLAEFKILDAYLARINSHDPGQRRVQFSKGELETLLGVKKINMAELKKRIQHLGIMITVEDFDDATGFRSVSLFEEAECKIDENGLWQVELQCTPQAMKYIFNIESIGYLRYKLRSIVALNSRYSYLLFLYLENNRFKHSWEVPVRDLQRYLDCTADFYSSFTEFNKNILKRCQRELQEKTSCRFSYIPIKRGRYVRKVRFILEPLSEIAPASTTDSRTNPSLPADSSTKYTCSEIDSDITEDLCLHGKDFLKTALVNPGQNHTEFSDKQLDEIFSYLNCIPLYKLPSLGPTCFDIEMQRYHYLSLKFAELNRRDESYGIRNRYSYFISILKDDIKS